MTIMAEFKTIEDVSVNTISQPTFWPAVVSNGKVILMKLKYMQ